MKDQIYSALKGVTEFNKLSMDAQGVVCQRVERIIKDFGEMGVWTEIKIHTLKDHQFVGEFFNPNKWACLIMTTTEEKILSVGPIEQIKKEFVKTILLLTEERGVETPEIYELVEIANSNDPSYIIQ